MALVQIPGTDIYVESTSIIGLEELAANLTAVFVPGVIEKIVVVDDIASVATDLGLTMPT